MYEYLIKYAACSFKKTFQEVLPRLRQGNFDWQYWTQMMFFFVIQCYGNFFYVKNLSISISNLLKEGHW